MPVDGLIDTNGAQAVQSIQLDIGGKDMDGVIAISDWDEEIKDISFVFLIPFWSSCLLFPVSVPPISVCFPVFVGHFQMSRMHLMLCQVLSSLAEYFQLFLIVVANFLILLCNSCQPLHDEEKFFSSGGTMSFESSTHLSRGKLQLTELMGGHHDHRWDGDGVLLVDHGGIDLRSDREGLSSVHVNGEA